MGLLAGPPCERAFGAPRIALGAHGRETMGVEAGDVGPQRARVRGTGRGEHLRGRPRLADLAVLQDHDLLRAGGRDREVMGDQQHPDPEIAAQVVEQVEDLLLHGDVECGGGLVGHEQARAGEDRQGDEHALELTARELMGEGAQDPLRILDTHPFEGGARERLAVRAAPSSGDERRGLVGLSSDRAHRIQRGARVLRHEAEHATAQREELPVPQRRELAPLQRDRAVHAGPPRREQPQHGARDRGLPRARFADQCERGALGHGEGDVVHDLGVAVGDAQAAHLQQRRRRERGVRGRGDRPLGVTGVLQDAQRVLP